MGRPAVVLTIVLTIVLTLIIPVQRASEAAGGALAKQPRPQKTASEPPVAAAAHTTGDLGDIFSKGEILQDRNGDGIVDFINCRIVVAADAPAADVVAAANIAARLGFETSAMSLPIGITDAEITPDENTLPLIVIGRTNKLVQRLVAEHKLDVSDLKAGQGLVSVIPAAFGSAEVIAVTGADDSGTVAAGDTVAARLPYLYQLRANSISKVEGDVLQFLESKDIRGASAVAPRIVYAAGSDTVDSLDVQVLVADDQLASAAAALQDIAAAHVVGSAEFGDRKADRLNYPELGNLRIRVSARRGGTERVIVISRFGPPYKNAFPNNPWEPKPRPLSLANLFTRNGLLLDQRGNDLIPDQTAATIILDDGEHGLVGAVDVAARIAMESSGVDLPLAKLSSQVKSPADEPNPILIGRTGQLLTEMGVGAGLTSGQGLVRIIPQGFGRFPAVVVTGADDAGLRAAANHLAGHVPYLAKTRRGEVDYGQIEDDVNQFFRARSTAGEAAAALAGLDRVVASLGGESLASIDAKVYTENERPDLAKAVEERLGEKIKGAKITASAPSRYGPVPVFDETYNLPWEVDDFWKAFRADVIPKVTPGSKVQIEVLLSESPEIREGIGRQAQEELMKAGASEATVRVICAYKQGFSWLDDVVLPQIKGKNPKHIVVKFPTLSPPPGVKWIGSPIRWLQELYPIDEVFAHELGIGVDDTVFEKVDGGPATYTVEVTDRSGAKILTDSFSPRFVAQEYFKAIPTATIDVTTGGLTAKVNGVVVADERIETDNERFWDIYQTKIMPRMLDYVRTNTGNRLGPENQPFFRDFKMEFWMSEPDFRLNYDEARMSPLESLHEDLTFDTIDFFAIFSGQSPGSRNVAPGRIMPIMHVRPGQAPTVEVSLTGNAVPKPRLVVSWQEMNGSKGSQTIDLAAVAIKPPRVVDEVVQADSVLRATVAVDAESAADATEAAQRAAAFAWAQQNSALEEDLGYANLAELDLQTQFGAATQVTRVPVADRAAAVAREEPKVIEPPAGQQIVTWDHPIFPDELEQKLIPELRTFPEINPYVIGHTYRQQNVWAMDVMLPMQASLWSQAKASALKPVLFITTRQHSNELSATSATMRLMELFAKDPQYRQYLNKINVVYNPIENPDGATDDEIYSKLDPEYISHGGYWSAVMRDVNAYVWDPDPLLPEALVRRKLYDEWLPDVYMNTHGYPSHEWVQSFAGFKQPWFLLFWIPRGYWINLHYIDDQNYPEDAAVGTELRERIIQEVQGIPFVRATNEEQIHEFEKYARRYQPDAYRLEVYKGMNIQHDYTYSYQDGGVFSSKIDVNSGKERPDEGGPDFLERYPQITVLDLGCDMPDEGESNQWMEKMAAPGQLAYVMAVIKLMYNSHYKTERFEEDYRDRVSLSVFRPRPIQASEAPASETDQRR